MKCPRCLTDTLKAEYYEKIEIDRCTSCSGAWLDDGELTLILQSQEKKFSADCIKESIHVAFEGIPDYETHTVEPCPKCASPMRAVNYSYSSGIVMDRCPNDHGIWFDKGELDKIQMHHEHWEEEKQNSQQNWQNMVAKIEQSEVSSWQSENKKHPLRYFLSSFAQRIFQ